MGKFTHFFFDQEAVPSLYTDSMNLVQPAAGRSKPKQQCSDQQLRKGKDKKNQPLVLRDIGLGME